MRWLSLVLVLTASTVSAQNLPPKGSGGVVSVPDPAPGDYAGQRIELEGFRLSTVNSLGTCTDAQKGLTLLLAAPVTANYVCFGTTIGWVRIYTENDGVLAHPDFNIPGRTFTSEAPSGAVAFRINNAGAYLHLGGLVRLYSDGTRIILSGSVQVPAGQSIEVPIITAPTNTVLQLLQTGKGYQFFCGNSLPAGLAAGQAGTMFRLCSDGRWYEWTGTEWLKLGRFKEASVAVTFAEASAGDDSVANVTIGFATVVGELVQCRGPGAGLGARFQLAECFASSTTQVTVRIHNSDATARTPPAGTWTFRFDR